MRVLLITPPLYRIIGFYNRYFPFGITLLGTVLEKRGHKVMVYDADYCASPDSIDYSQMSSRYDVYLKSFKDKNNLIWKEFEKNIKKFNPDVVGISAFTTFAASVFYTAKLCRKALPKCKIIIGGPHATVKSDEIFEVCPEVDYIIRGEAEESMVDLLDSIRSGEANLKSILGLSWRENGEVLVNKDRFMERDINKFPMPDRSLLFNEDKMSSEDMGLIMTSRGCPYHCTYCASTKGLSLRGVDEVLQEIVYVMAKYGTRQFTLKDDSFTIDKKRVEELCEKIIKMKLRISWECNTRINLIDKNLLTLMKKAGCNFIKIGIESGSARMLKLMKKGITLAQVRRAAKLLHQSGIHWSGYFMIGVVDETEEDIRKTMDFIREIKPNLVILGVYEPFPGTEMYRQGIERGLIKDKMSLKDFYTTWPSNYYKVDSRTQNNVISPERFGKLEEEVTDFVRRYNMKPKNLWVMIMAKRRVYMVSPKTFIEDVNKFFKYVFGKIKRE